MGHQPKREALMVRLSVLFALARLGACVSAKECDAQGLGKKSKGCLEEKHGNIKPPKRCEDSKGKMPCLVCPDTEATCDAAAGEDAHDPSTRTSSSSSSSSSKHRRRLLSKNRMMWATWCPWCN